MKRFLYLTRKILYCSRAKKTFFFCWPVSQCDREKSQTDFAANSRSTTLKRKSVACNWLKSVCVSLVFPPFPNAEKALMSVCGSLTLVGGVSDIPDTKLFNDLKLG